MFGFLKKKKPAQSEINVFLDKADDALTLAYEQGDVHSVIPFLHPRLLDLIIEEINSGKDMTQELGLAKYRVRTWSTPRMDSQTIVVHKKLRHKDVKIRGMISIPVGDNIDEDWFVESSNGSFLVVDIRRIYEYGSV